MKLKITKTLKIFLIVINALLILTMSAYLFLHYTIPQFTEENQIVYNYTNKADVNYKVFLKPNVLNEDNINEGEIYITEYVDYINTSFSYNFEGERSADIRGDYEIIAVMEGHIGENDSYTTIWKKEFVTLRKTYIKAEDSNMSIVRDIQINLKEYKDFAARVIDDSKINSNIKLTIYMNVNIEVETDKGPIKESISPSVEIPLNTNYFMITKNNTEEIVSAIEETVQMQLPVNKTILLKDVAR